MTLFHQNWKISKLGDIAETSTGGTPSRKRQEYYGGQIPWVKSGELNDDFLYNTEEKITLEGLNNSSAKLLPPQTLLVALYGATAGKTAILEIQAATNQAVCAIFPKNKIIDRYFLRYFIIHNRQYILNQRYGGAQPNISQTIIRNIEIIYPPLEEQRKIAGVLSLVQDAIAQQEQLIALTTELKKSLMHKLFTEGTCGEPQKKTEIGVIPESWDIASIDQHCDSSAFGPRFSSKEYQLGGEIVTLRTTDMDDDGNIDYTKAPLATLNKDRFGKHFLKIGDIVVSRSGTCGIASVFTGHANPVLPGAFLIRLRMKESIIPQFLRHYINSPVGRPRILQLAEGAIQKNISGTRLKKFLIPICNLQEQSEIVESIDLLEQKIVFHKQKHRVSKSLFQTLLDQLMTAQIRADDLNLSALNLKLQGGNE